MLVGQSWLGCEALALLQRLGHDVPCVAAPTDDRLAKAAIAADIPVFDPLGRLAAAWVPEGVDVILCAHAHCFVTAGARAKARLGALGYHPSLLPRHRGRDAVRWTIHMRDVVAGGTVYWMTDKADAGPLAAQEWCWVRPDDGAASLWRRELGPMGVMLIERVLGDLGGGRIVAVEQDERMATWEPSFERPALRGRLGAG